MRQTKTQGCIQPERQGGRVTGREAYRQRSRQADRDADRQTEMQHRSTDAGMHTERQRDRKKNAEK